MMVRSAITRINSPWFIHILPKILTKMQQRIKKLKTYKDEENGAEDNSECYGHSAKAGRNPLPKVWCGCQD